MPRATVDLDFVVDGEGQEALIRFLESLGYRTLHRSTGYSNHQHPDGTRGGVDVVYVREPTSGMLFEGARSLEGPGGLRVPVPRPEHLIAMKVVAMKNDPTRTYQDMADIQFLLRLPEVDRDSVRARSKNLEWENAIVSSKTPEPFDLERDVPTTAEDVAALRRIRESRRLSFSEYLSFVSRLRMPAGASRERRTHGDCEPFEL